MALNLDKRKIGRKIILFAAICGVLGAIGAFKPLTLGLYTLQTKAGVKPVSGDIVIVGIDSASLNEIGRWPWPRDKQAELIRKIDGYGPKAVYVDLGYNGKTNPAEDNALRQTLEGMKAPVKVIATATGQKNGIVQSTFSDAAAVGSTPAVTSFVPYLFGHVWELPVSIDSEKGRIGSPASSITGLSSRNEDRFRVDYSYDPNTIPNVSAGNILNGLAVPTDIKNKTVIIGFTEIWHNDIHEMPGWGTRPGVEMHVMGAETLKNGLPQELGWLPFFLFACVIAALHLTRVGLQWSRPNTFVSVAVILGASTWLTTLHIGNDPLPAVVFLVTSAVYIARQKAALVRSQRNVETGFSDMTGYGVSEVVSNSLIIAASLSRAETQRGYVLADDNIKIMKEVGRRLSTVIDERQLTHNDEQQFLWEMPPIATHELASHLEGLRQLFVDPLVVDGRKIDIYIFFGVDRDVTSNVKHRMKSALRASEDARNSEATFKIATSTSFEQYLETRFNDEFVSATANGDIRIMFEAQPSLVDGRVQSAEAVIQWTHPAHGQIAKHKMFELARKSGNLDRISLFLCDQAIVHAGRFRDYHKDFAVSVKITSEILAGPQFQSHLLATVESARCEPSNIVLEVIDIHEHKNSERVRTAILELRRKGFRMGIGNFGATNADIDLLRIFTPDEIFLVKTFSAELLGSTSNQIFADGVLRIARATGVVSTADGIDDRDVLAALQKRGCDRGKGKIIAIALNFNDFIETHLVKSAKKAG